MLQYLVTSVLAPKPRPRRDRIPSPACRHSRFHSFRPLVEVLECRTLLSFITAPSYAAGPNPDAVAVGDFNGDGHPDLVVTNPTYPSGMVSVLLSNGDGSFQPARNFLAGS